MHLKGHSHVGWSILLIILVVVRCLFVHICYTIRKTTTDMAYNRILMLHATNFKYWQIRSREVSAFGGFSCLYVV